MRNSIFQPSRGHLAQLVFFAYVATATAATIITVGDSALSLSNFQLITELSVPLGCLLSYNNPISGCQASDFDSRRTCSVKYHQVHHHHGRAASDQHRPAAATINTTTAAAAAGVHYCAHSTSAATNYNFNTNAGSASSSPSAAITTNINYTSAARTAAGTAAAAASANNHYHSCHHDPNRTTTPGHFYKASG
ncbi:hypothetical protein LZ30DRAFT_776332 [Colletotrichum cereale]|nr:hypothetical protein LZ30DRAFT_776332 [Colletotrichum cereale]